MARDTITPISPAPTTLMPGAYARPPSMSHYHQQPRLAVPPRQSVKFRESPFYQVKEPLTSLRELIGSYLAPLPHILATVRI